jgi:hypothetical protein
MADYLGQEFKSTTLVVDGCSYDQCNFDNCKIVYRGGVIPTFSRCKLVQCTWIWEDAALRTIGFLRGIYSGMGPNGRQMIEGVLTEIRTPFREGKP